MFKHQYKDCATKEDEDAWGEKWRKLGPEAAESCARAGLTLQYTEAIDGLVSCQPQASLTGSSTQYAEVSRLKKKPFSIFLWAGMLFGDHINLAVVLLAFLTCNKCVTNVSFCMGQSNV